ncbi:unnamed protein product [Prunus armeniaca]
MRRSIGTLNAQARLASHYCASCRFVLLNEMTASEVPPRHRACERIVRPLRLSREPCPFVLNSSANIKSLAFFIFLHSFPSILTCSSGLPSVASPEPGLSHIRRSSRRGLIQMVFSFLLSTNYPSSWKVDVGQGHGVAEIPSRPWGRMTFLLMRPWRNCNAIDEDGRAWCDDSNLAMFVWPSTLVAPMAGVMVLASPSHSCAQNDGPGHGPSDSLDCNPVSPMSRVTSLPVAAVSGNVGGGGTA